jgi:O-antigen ligase
VDSCRRALRNVSSCNDLSGGLVHKQNISSGAGFLVGSLMLGGIAWSQVCLGGTRPAFAYPGYLLLGCAGLLSIVLIRTKRCLPRWELLVSTGLFFGYLLVRGSFSSLAFLATTNALLILAALITYTLTAVFLTRVRTRLLLIVGFVWLEAGHLWVGLTQFVSGNKWLLFDYLRPDYGSRASGFYVCPNHLAGFLETLALTLLALGLFSRVSTWLRVICFYFGCAGFAGVVITGSRGGYLSSAAGIAVLAIYGVYHLIWVERFRWSLLLAGGACGFIMLLLGFAFVAHSDLLSGRFGSIAEPQDIRPRLWQAGMRAFDLQPVVGMGAGTYLVYGREFRDPVVQTDPIYAHNDYVQLLAEYGVIAGALLLWFLATHFLAAWRYVGWKLRRLQRNESALSSSLALVIGAAAGIVALEVHSIFDFNLQIPGNTLFAAFLFGILANPGVSEQRNQSASWGWIWRALPLVLSVISIGLIVPRWRGESEVEAARWAFLKGAYPLAIYHAKQAAQSGNQDPDLYYYLGESRRLLANQFAGAFRGSFLKAAAEAFDQGLEYFPMDERSLVKGGLTRAELGDFQKADTYFNQAFKWDPNLGQIFALYGARLQLEGRNQDAISAYHRSNELSGNPIALGGIKQIEESMKQRLH